MALWSTGGSKDATSVQAVLLLVAAAASMRRAELYDFAIGSNAVSADTTFLWIVQRCTTAGTGAALTPNANDPADPIAATTVVKDTVTVDPTLTAAAFLARIPLNQKATYRWATIPGTGIIIPATASNGVILGLSAATTTLFAATASFNEH